MSRAPFQSILGVVVVGLAWMTVSTIGQSASPPSTKNGDWPDYTADLKGTQVLAARPDQRRNFNKLEVAWRFKTDNLGTRPEYKLEGTPLMVKGVLYATAGTRRSVVALDAQNRRADVGAQPERRQARRRLRRGSSRAAACRTGPTARATSGSSTSPPATAWSRSTRRPASRSRRSARTASSISR